MNSKAHQVGPHISVKAETIFTISGFKVTNSLLLSSIVFVFFLIIALVYSREFLKNQKSRFFYFFTYALKSLYDLFYSVFGEKTDYFFPLVASFFFFILFQNEAGLIPGVGTILVKIQEGNSQIFAPLLRGNTADLNSTLSLALISVGFSQYVGVKHLGLGNYLKKFINVKNPMVFFTGIMETISELSKVVAFSFRLFVNIFAGEVIIAIVAFLIPVLFSFPFLLFEIFIGFIQAIVFSMLSAVFFSMAMEEAH